MIADLSIFVDALRFIEENPGLLWDKTVEHLRLSVAAVGAALVIAVPIGILLASSGSAVPLFDTAKIHAEAAASYALAEARFAEVGP